MEKVTRKIAATLRELRKSRAWSLDTAAIETGVSKAMLGQIERQESSPTIAILWKIATGFDVSFSTFIYEGKKTLKKRAPKFLHPKNNLIKVDTLVPYDKNLHFEVFLIELLPGCEHVSLPHKKGVVEHAICFSGEVEVFSNGKWIELSAGESYKIIADKEHGYRNTTKSNCCFHNIIHYS